MSHLTYRIHKNIFDLFPGYRLGVLVFTGLDNTGSRPELIALQRAAEDSARAKVTGAVTELPVVAAWRDAYKKFGAKPSEHRSSIEALLRRVVKPDALPMISPLVDIGTTISVKHFVPAGVHPFRHAETIIELRLARAGDRFVAASNEPAEEVTPGEVVLADQQEVLTRRWTWRQSVNTRMSESTSAAFFNVDALAATADRDLRAAMEETERLVSQFCGGVLVRSVVLDASDREFSCDLG
jgi:DNA/RNA-binding domain of Phe-tRNA-synthetase-like protein